MRAKLRIKEIVRTEYGEQLKLSAVCKDGSYPQDGSDEDNTFARFTPTAELTMTVQNPALFGKFNPGQKFYVDFTPVLPPAPIAEPPPEAE